MQKIKITSLILLCSANIAFADNSYNSADPESLEFAKEYSKRMRNAPSTMEVITREKIRRYGSITLDEALEKIIGIHISRASDGNATQRIVRGINSRWIILVNGMEIDRILSDVKSMPLSDIERIEVVKGSHFSIYGEDAIAGTINLVSFSPQENSGSVNVFGGTGNTVGANARVHRNRGLIGYSFHLGAFTEGGTTRIIEADRQTGFDQLLDTEASQAPGEGYFDREIKQANLTLEYGNSLTWRNFYYERDAGLGSGLAQALGDGRQKFTRYTTDLRYRHNINNGDVEARLGYNSIYAEFADAKIFPNGSFGGLFPDGVIQDVGQYNNEVSFEAILTKRLKNQTLRIGVGANIVDVVNDYDNRNYTIEPGNPIPQPLGGIENQLENPLFREYTENLSHVSIRDEINFNNGWKFNAGVRFDNSSIYGAVVNPRASMEYTPDLYTSYKILYGEATRTPNNLEISSNGLFVALGDENLTPSKIRMLEGVVEQNITSTIKSRLNVFAYEYNDIIGTTESAASPNGLQYANIDSVQKGHGAEINVQLIKGWNVNINTTGVLDRSRLERDDRPKIKDYQLVNMAVTNNSIWNKNVEVSFVVNNIFDADAREDISTAIEDDLPINDRVVRLGLSWKF